MPRAIHNIVAEAEQRLGPAGTSALAATIRSKTARLRIMRECPSPGSLAQALIPATVQTAMLRRLDQAIIAADAGAQRRWIINTPPQEGKTDRICRDSALWLLLRNPDRRIIIASYQQNLAERSTLAVRRLIETYGSRPGNLDEDNRLGLAIDPARSAAGNWRVAGHDGGMVAVGIGSGTTGRPGDVIVVDDPLADPEAADSPIQRQKVIDWWTGVIQTRLVSTSLVIVVQTRWNEEDLSGWLIENNGTGTAVDAPRYSVLSVPAQAETDDPLGRQPGEWLESARGRTANDWEATKKEIVKGGVRWWFCTPGDTPIVMGDWTTRPISQVNPGDMVMGYTRGDSIDRLRLVPTVVEDTRSREDVVQTMNLASGARVRCTPSHRWYTGRDDISRPMYAPAKVGSRLFRFDPVLPELTPRRQRFLDYLAGMADGEGCWQASALAIAQSPDSNPEVFAKIGEVLNELGYKYNVRLTDHGKYGNHTWGRGGIYVINDPRGVAVELIRRTEMAKKPHALTRLLDRPHMPTRFRDRVESIEPGGIETVYSLQTGTGNYIAAGYASSNSLYQQRPAPPSGDTFKLEWFDRDRVWKRPPGPPPVVVIDPADNTGAGDEAGIIVGSTDARNQIYLGPDYSGYYTVGRWVRVALLAVARHKAGMLVYEQSLSGLARDVAVGWEQLHKQAKILRRLGATPVVDPDIAEAAVRELAHPDDPDATWEQYRTEILEVWPLVEEVLAYPSTGPSIRRIIPKGTKAWRAQAASPRYEQRGVSHIGALPELEHQMTTWMPGQKSPDRMDAAVHTVMLLSGATVATLSSPSGKGELPTRSTRNPSHRGGALPRSTLTRR